MGPNEERIRIGRKIQLGSKNKWGIIGQDRLYHHTYMLNNFTFRGIALTSVILRDLSFFLFSLDLVLINELLLFQNIFLSTNTCMIAEFYIHAMYTVKVRQYFFVA